MSQKNSNQRLQDMWERGLVRATEEHSREHGMSEVELETAEPFKLRTNLHAGVGSYGTPRSATATTVQDE